jgi:hypothetical protein
VKVSSASSTAEARDRFVFVEEDGSIRELTLEEAEHLATPFHPADGGRPYIKSRYKSRTPSGSVSGFLARQDVPDHLR